MSTLIAPSPAHRLDTGALGAYLEQHLPGLGGLYLRQYQGGQSNPTYLVEASLGRFVLRKKPPGVLLPSAHQIEREYRIIAALHGSDVPVPRPVHLCEDASIIGTPFFLMEHVEGQVFENPDLAMLPLEARRAYFLGAIDTLAKLHKVDWRAAGLEGFGRPENYLARQVERWAKQYRAAVIATPDANMEALITWLPANLPAQSPVAIAHGDFRIGNLIFSADAPDVAAVLDWELSTIGDPFGDLAYCCLAYHLPHGAPGVKGLAGLDLVAAGLPSERELVAEYCRRMGLAGVEGWTFYITFALFRLVSILQGVHARALQGNASSTNALQAGSNAALLARIACDFAGA